MNPILFVRELQAARGSNEKKGMLRRGLKDPIIAEILYRTLSPYITYGITPPTTTNLTNRVYTRKGVTGDTVVEPAVEYYPVKEISSQALQHLYSILDELSIRKLTGIRAKMAISELMANRTLGWLAWHIISKDLRAGVSAKTVNSVKPGTIPQFDVALASPGGFVSGGHLRWDDKLEHPTRAMIAEPKLDGLRCLIIVREGCVVETLSREGKPLNLPRIQSAMQIFPRGVYDSEAMHPDGFKATVKRARKKTADDEGIIANIFDHIDLEDFEDGHETQSQLQRNQWLRGLDITSNPDWGEDCIRLVNSWMVRDQTEIMQAYVASRTAGHEGIILKDPEAPYAFKRTKNWLKIKERLSVTGKIVGIEEGKGKHVGKMGALWVEGTVEHKGEQIPFRTKVGSGFTDDDREHFWTAKDSDHAAIEVAYQEVTKADSKDVHALRFPIYLGERGD